jgi:hypothetical protein
MGSLVHRTQEQVEGGYWSDSGGHILAVRFGRSTLLADTPLDRESTGVGGYFFRQLGYIARWCEDGPPRHHFPVYQWRLVAGTDANRTPMGFDTPTPHVLHDTPGRGGVVLVMSARFKTWAADCCDLVMGKLWFALKAFQHTMVSVWGYLGGIRLFTHSSLMVIRLRIVGGSIPPHNALRRCRKGCVNIAAWA